MVFKTYVAMFPTLYYEYDTICHRNFIMIHSHEKHVKQCFWEGYWEAIKWNTEATWTWTWANSTRQWGTRMPGVLQSMGSQRVRHDLATEQQRQQATLKQSYCCFLITNIWTYFSHYLFLFRWLVLVIHNIYSALYHIRQYWCWY